MKGLVKNLSGAYFSPMKGTIVYVDDEDHNLYLFEGTFELDFNIITYLSANKLLEDQSVLENADILITDMKMPEMSGMELISEIKKAHPNLPTYILSAYPFEREVSGMIAEGTVRKFFSKPFNTAELFDEFEKVLEEKG